MPSHYESFGMVALEAMACATPVIVSDVGGLGFLVQDGITGFTVPNADPDLLLIGRAYEECRFIERLRAEFKSMERSKKDETLRHAVASGLCIISRAAALISPGLKESHPGIQWKLLAGFSEKLFMPYHEPDWTFVWEAVDREIPSIERVFREILAER